MHREIFDRLCEYKRRHGLPTWEEAFEQLLAGEEAMADL
jgi:hypothetical protein